MATLNRFIKDPDAVLDFKFDFAPKTNESPGGQSDWLASGESIDSYVITITAADEETPALTLDSDSLTDTNTSVTAWLSGGTAGINYVVNCEITTDSGIPRVEQRSIIIQCRDR